jgi:hypothetical protein
LLWPPWLVQDEQPAVVVVAPATAEQPEPEMARVFQLRRHM